MQIFAPFTPQQITALDHWQNAGRCHPFTCGNDHPEPRNLIPTRDGWVCAVCDYKQDWAHDFMAALPTPEVPGESEEDSPRSSIG